MWFSRISKIMLVFLFLMISFSPQIRAYSCFSEFHNHNLTILSGFDYPSDDAFWNQTYGGQYTDIGRALVEVSTSGFAIVGYTASKGAGNYDVWLIRTDQTGSLLWDQTYGGIANDMGASLIECSQGGFAIVGTTESFGTGDEDAWLIRTDADGNLLWNRTFGGSGNDRGQTIVECQNGGFAIGGYSESFGAGLEDFWLIHTNTTGHLLWHRTYGGYNRDFGYSLVEANSGGFVLIGETASFGAGDNDVWLVRTNTTGHLLWHRTYGGSGSELGYSIIEVTTGGFGIIGWTYSFGVGSSDVWLIRVDSNGNHVWNHTFGQDFGDWGVTLAETNDGGFVLVGDSEIPGPEWSAQILLIRTEQNGTLRWIKTYGGSNYDSGSALIEIHNDTYAITGFTQSYGTGSRDVWLLLVPDTTPPTSTPPPAIPGFPWFAIIPTLIITIITSLIHHRKTKAPSTRKKAIKP